MSDTRMIAHKTTTILSDNSKVYSVRLAQWELCCVDEAAVERVMARIEAAANDPRDVVEVVREDGRDSEGGGECYRCGAQRPTQPKTIHICSACKAGGS